MHSFKRASNLFGRVRLHGREIADKLVSLRVMNPQLEEIPMDFTCPRKQLHKQTECPLCSHWTLNFM